MKGSGRLGRRGRPGGKKKRVGISISEDGTRVGGKFSLKVGGNHLELLGGGRSSRWKLKNSGDPQKPGGVFGAGKRGKIPNKDGKGGFPRKG